ELSPEGETESRRAQSFSPAGPDAGGQLRLGIFQTGVFGELCSDGFGAFRSGLDKGTMAGGAGLSHPQEPLGDSPRLPLDATAGVGARRALRARLLLRAPCRESHRTGES